MFKLRLVSLGRLDAALTNTSDPENVLDSIATFFQAMASRNFTTRMAGNGDWAPRMNPNVPGIINDLSKVKQPKARRFDDYPTPFNTGLLSRSTKGKVESRSRVVIGVHGPAQSYADAQHSGGESELDPYTPTFVKNAASWLKNKGKAYANSLGWMANEELVGKTYKIQVRARPWLNFTQRDREDLLRLLPGALLSIDGKGLIA